VPVLQPWYWNAGQLGTVGREIVSPSGLYQPVYVRTFIYVGVAASIALVVGYAVAFFITFHAGRRRGLFLVLVVAPIWISYVMRMYSWQGLLVRDGLFNRLFVLLPGIHQPVNWLEGRSMTVVLGLVYGYLPYLILPLFGQMTRIDPAMLEASGDLGVGPLRTLMHVTIPLSKPGILAGLMIITLPMMGDYFTTTMLSGSPRTAMIGNIIDNSVNLPGLGGTGAIVALTLVALLLAPMVFYMRYSRAAGYLR
jgi:spermidine/putrescine transport system permease protein